MEEDTSENQVQSEVRQGQSVPPNVPQAIAEQFKGSNNKYVVIGLIGAIVLIAVGITVFAWFQITTPRTEQKVGLPAADNAQPQEAQAQVVCGTPPEPLDTSNMEVSEFVPNLVVNEWYVDPNDPNASYLEIRNISQSVAVTDSIQVIMEDDSFDPGEFPRKANGGVLPVQEVGPGCLLVVYPNNLTLTQDSDFGARGLATTGQIGGDYLIFGSRSGNGGQGSVEFLPNMPAGHSVSLTSAGKYVAAPKTPGQYNNAEVKPAFQPSAAAISYFKEVVPYIPRDNPNQRIIAKWTRSEVPVGVSSNASPEDRACVEKAVQEVRELTGLNMPGKSFDTKIGFRRSINVFFAPPSEFPEWAGQNTQAVARGTWHGGEFTNHIDEGEVYINPALLPQEKCQLIYYGIGRALGVMRNGKSHPDSMFNEALAPAPGYTAIDKEIIRMLYDRLIEPGDTLEDINRVFPG